jgi:hypothetical protein
VALPPPLEASAAEPKAITASEAAQARICFFIVVRFPITMMRQ